MVKISTLLSKIWCPEQIRWKNHTQNMRPTVLKMGFFAKFGPMCLVSIRFYSWVQIYWWISLINILQVRTFLWAAWFLSDVLNTATNGDILVLAEWVAATTTYCNELYEKCAVKQAFNPISYIFFMSSYNQLICLRSFLTVSVRLQAFGNVHWGYSNHSTALILVSVVVICELIYLVIWVSAFTSEK